MQPDGPVTLLAFAGLNASLVRTKRCRYLTAPAHFSKAHNARAMCHNRLRSAGKTANGCLTAQRRGISLPMLECKHAIPCGNGTVLAIPLPSGTRSRISLQAYIGFAGTGGFSPKGTKALLGMRQGSQICPAALVVQHRFRRPAARISRQAKAKEQQLLPLPSHLPRLEAAFPCKLTSVSPERVAFPRREQRRCLGCAKVPKFALRHWLCSTRFRPLPAAFRGRLRLRSNNCFGLPPFPRSRIRSRISHKLASVWPAWVALPRRKQKRCLE